MSMKPGCVVYSPQDKNWCVLVEQRREDGEVRRFMSFHDSYHDAHSVEEAHKESHADDPDVTVSVFEYDYIANEIELASRFMMQVVEDILSSINIVDFDDGENDGCED